MSRSPSSNSPNNSSSRAGQARGITPRGADVSAIPARARSRDNVGQGKRKALPLPYHGAARVVALVEGELAGARSSGPGQAQGIAPTIPRSGSCGCAVEGELAGGKIQRARASARHCPYHTTERLVWLRRRGRACRGQDPAGQGKRKALPLPYHGAARVVAP